MRSLVVHRHIFVSCSQHGKLSKCFRTAVWSLQSYVTRSSRLHRQGAVLEDDEQKNGARLSEVVTEYHELTEIYDDSLHLEL